MTEDTRTKTDSSAYDERYLSYTGIQMPLKLVSPITEQEIENRNTWFGAKRDEQGRICLIHKLVYGSVELAHYYGYDDAGRLAWAEIRSIDDEGKKLWFDGDGKLVRQEDLDDED